MYKTVKHGENSLQYTILPQTEDPLQTGGMPSRGRQYRPFYNARAKNSTILTVYCLFFLIILVLILVLYLFPIHSPSRWDIERAIEAYNKGKMDDSVKYENVYGRDRSIKKDDWEDLKSASMTKTNVRLRSTSPPKDLQVKIPLSTPPPWSMPALRSWKSAVSLTTSPPIVAVVPHDDIPLITPANDITTGFLSLLSPKPSQKVETVKPTSIPDVITFRNKISLTSTSTTEDITLTVAEKTENPTPKLKYDSDLVTYKPSTTKMSTLAPTTERSKMQELKDMLFSDDDDVEFKNSLEVDEAFTLPPLKADYPVSVETDDVTVSKTPNSGWYAARWPFVDTSSYFQWTGYSSGDNLLLPLLVAAVSSATLVFLLALAVKRRKKTFINAGQDGDPTTVQVDDNTNLLVAENPEEHEE